MSSIDAKRGNTGACAVRTAHAKLPLHSFKLWNATGGIGVWEQEKTGARGAGELGTSATSSVLKNSAATSSSSNFFLKHVSDSWGRIRITGALVALSDTDAGLSDDGERGNTGTRCASCSTDFLLSVHVTKNDSDITLDRDGNCGRVNAPSVEGSGYFLGCMRQACGKTDECSSMHPACESIGAQCNGFTKTRAKAVVPMHYRSEHRSGTDPSDSVHLWPGGVTRQVTTLLDNWAHRGYSVTVGADAGWLYSGGDLTLTIHVDSMLARAPPPLRRGDPDDNPLFDPLAICCRELATYDHTKTRVSGRPVEGN